MLSSTSRVGSREVVPDNGMSAASTRAEFHLPTRRMTSSAVENPLRAARPSTCYALGSMESDSASGSSLKPAATACFTCVDNSPTFNPDTSLALNDTTT